MKERPDLRAKRETLQKRGEIKKMKNDKCFRKLKKSISIVYLTQ